MNYRGDVVFCENHLDVKNWLFSIVRNSAFIGVLQGFTVGEVISRISIRVDFRKASTSIPFWHWPKLDRVYTVVFWTAHGKSYPVALYR